MSDRRQEIVLLRHGETEWSRDGRHTGRSDIPLTPVGREQAAHAGEALRGRAFARVLVSPLQRARQTCALAGFDGRAELRNALMEWDYGEYEGLTGAQVRETRPDWLLWRDGCPGGELPEDVGTRADTVVAELRARGDDALVIAHGHLLRVLASRWIDRPAEHGAHLALTTAAVCVLGSENGRPTLQRWNDASHLRGAV